MSESLLHRRMMMEHQGGINPYIQCYGTNIENGAFAALPNLLDFPNGSTLGVEIVARWVENNKIAKVYGNYDGGGNGMRMYVNSNGFLVVSNNYSRPTSYRVERDTIYRIRHNYLADGLFYINGTQLIDAELIATKFVLNKTNRGVHFGIGTIYDRFDSPTQSGTYTFDNIIYELTLTKENAIYAHMIPDIRNGEAGFYDETHDVFYPSITDNPLIYGMDNLYVPPSW